MTLAISSHGMLLAVELTPGGAFTTIAELGDIDYPEMSRNEFDATTQDKDIDSKVYGVMRRGDLSAQVNFLPTNNTHDHLTGMQKLFFDNTVTGFRLTPPVASGGPVWIMSGQVKKFNIKAPVDGKYSADTAIGLSGLMSVGGAVIGE